MHRLVYEYEVDPVQADRFEQAYRADGDWAGFFRGGAGHLGSELLRDSARPGHYRVIDRWTSARPGRYRVIDRWTSADAAARFLSDHAGEYARRSRATAHLSLREARLGMFDLVAPC